MPQVQINATYPLRAQLEDGNSAQFPRAAIYDASATLIGGADLSSVNNGLYAGTYTFNATGFYTVVYTIYSDAGHTIINPAYSRTEELVECVDTTSTVSSAVWDALLADHQTTGSVGEALTVIRGLLQYNYILDQTDYNTKGLLVSGRIRIFPTKADTDAGTNPIATLTITGTAEAPPDNNLGQILKVTVN